MQKSRQILAVLCWAVLGLLGVDCVPSGILLTVNASEPAQSPDQARDTAYYSCPGVFRPDSPWYPDDRDCACYYVCKSETKAVRMCCPEGLWWDVESNTCLYLSDFSDKQRETCVALSKGAGTTVQLREIFIGRCWEYQRFIAPEAFKDGYKNCEHLFDSFANAFVSRAPCGEVYPEDYEGLIEEASMLLPPDSQIFWSGAYYLAQDYVANGKRGFTLESTLIGYILNDVTWCGQSSSPGINFESCPAFASCSGHVMTSFWALALEKFASQAEGAVTVILDGSRLDGPSFRNNSFFAEHELPKFNLEKVELVRVWLAHDLDLPYSETCDTGGSLDILRSLVEEKGIDFVCEDNPPYVYQV